jgi:tetratricopeptide (TPR) repeat protein
MGYSTNYWARTLKSLSRKRMTDRILLLLAAVGLLTSSVAFASEQSKRLYSRGLVEFHAQRYAAALQLFDQAVAADPDDPYALYYRGVTLARQGDYAGAIRDLREVLAKAPIKQATLELGIAMVQSEQYAAAIPWLEQAQRVPALEARASLFLGIAQLRLGQKSAASVNFDRAARDPALSLPARYYRGVVSYQQEAWPQAQEDFAYVANTSPDSAMGREAKAFLASMAQAGRAAVRAYGSFGLQYDSNVVLAPSSGVLSSAALGVTRQGDGRGTIAVGAAYAPWLTDLAQFSIGYDFYQGLQFHLTQFNFQDNRVTAQAAANAGRFRFGVVGNYDYFLLSTDSFLSEVAGTPWTSIDEGDFGHTDLLLRVRYRDFKVREFTPHDGVNYAAGFRQFANLGAPDRYVWLGYQFDRESESHSNVMVVSTSDDMLVTTNIGNPFGYYGNQVETGISWLLPASVAAEASYAFRYEYYDPSSTSPFAPIGQRRHDDVHEVTVVFRKQLTEMFGLTAAYLGTFDNSNEPLFTYNRNIGSVAVDVSFY